MNRFFSSLALSAGLAAAGCVAQVRPSSEPIISQILTDAVVSNYPGKTCNEIISGFRAQLGKIGFTDVLYEQCSVSYSNPNTGEVFNLGFVSNDGYDDLADSCSVDIASTSPGRHRLMASYDAQRVLHKAEIFCEGGRLNRVNPDQTKKVYDPNSANSKKKNLYGTW